MTERTTERIPFRLINTECCHTLLCWVNPRFPNYCPECGTRCYPEVRGWVLEKDEQAILKVKRVVQNVIYENVFREKDNVFREEENVFREKD